MKEPGHRQRHRGPLLTFLFQTKAELQTRVVTGPGARERVAGLLKQLGLGRRVLFLSQGQAGDAWGLLAGLEKDGYLVTPLSLPDGEEGKTLKSLQSVWQSLQANDFGREDTIVAAGGGALTDIAGFAASTYMRGLPLILLPTTLLAQVDAAIGGKTAINLAQGKNLAGTIYFPRAVVVDSEVLASLPRRQFASGLAEVIKYALIEATVARHTEYRPGPRPLFDVLEGCLDDGFAFSNPLLPSIVDTCIKMKLAVVGKDPLETGLRACLNLGHTLGHALEKVSAYQLTHGEAIACGMKFACELSISRGLFRRAEASRIAQLLAAAGIPPVSAGDYDRDLLIAAIGKDKKRRGQGLRFVLPVEQIGCVDWEQNFSFEELAEHL